MYWFVDGTRSFAGSLSRKLGGGGADKAGLALILELGVVLRLGERFDSRALPFPLFVAGGILSSRVD